MNEFLEFCQGFNIQNLIGTGVMIWLFMRHIESKMDKLEAKIDVQSQRTDRLYEMFIDLLKNKT